MCTSWRAVGRGGGDPSSPSRRARSTVQLGHQRNAGAPGATEWGSSSPLVICLTSSTAHPMASKQRGEEWGGAQDESETGPGERQRHA
jgi:hypothetical protein